MLTQSLRLEFYEDKIAIYKFRVSLLGVEKTTLLGNASYSDVKECRYKDPYAVFYGATVGGVTSVNMPVSIEMNIQQVGHIIIRGEDNSGLSEKDLKALFDWIHDKISPIE